jgi:hypothetical protein
VGMRRSRARSWAKWTLAVLLVLNVVVTMVSWKYGNEWRGESGFSMDVCCGRVIMGRTLGYGTGWNLFYDFYPGDIGQHFRFLWRTGRGLWYLGIPTWALFVVTLIPATLVWWPDVRSASRRHRGHCPACGYDRRGLAADAKCPECGNSTLPPTPPASFAPPPAPPSAQSSQSLPADPAASATPASSTPSGPR